jgi:hypothetical protein
MPSCVCATWRKSGESAGTPFCYLARFGIVRHASQVLEEAQQLIIRAVKSSFPFDGVCSRHHSLFASCSSPRLRTTTLSSFNAVATSSALGLGGRSATCFRYCSMSSVFTWQFPLGSIFDLRWLRSSQGGDCPLYSVLKGWGRALVLDLPCPVAYTIALVHCD